MTFEQAKDQVAVKYSHANWKIAECRVGRNDIDKMYTEAAESYGESKWDEACEAQQLVYFDHVSVVEKPEFKP